MQKIWKELSYNKYKRKNSYKRNFNENKNWLNKLIKNISEQGLEVAVKE